MDHGQRRRSCTGFSDWVCHGSDEPRHRDAGEGQPPRPTERSPWSRRTAQPSEGPRRRNAVWRSPDQLDVEVVVLFENQPGKSFGFQLRKDSHQSAADGMLELLRTAFNQDEPVRIDYETVGPNSGKILRVMIVPPEPSFPVLLPLISK